MWQDVANDEISHSVSLFERFDALSREYSSAHERLLRKTFEGVQKKAAPPEGRFDLTALRSMAPLVALGADETDVDVIEVVGEVPNDAH